MPTDRSKVGRRSKRKGNKFENDVAKILQSWWFPEKGFVFKRTPVSGGFSSAKDFNVCGDIICSDPEFPFTVECKNNKAVKGLHDFLNPKSLLSKFWEQSKTEAEESKKFPLLVFHWSNGPVFFVMPCLNNLNLKNYSFPHFEFREEYADNVVIFELNTFKTIPCGIFDEKERKNFNLKPLNWEQ